MQLYDLNCAPKLLGTKLLHLRKTDRLTTGSRDYCWKNQIDSPAFQEKVMVKPLQQVQQIHFSSEGAMNSTSLDVFDANNSVVSIVLMNIQKSHLTTNENLKNP